MTRTLGLAGHAAYACRHSGACCTSGWPIPVESALLPLLRRALADRRVLPSSAPALVVPAAVPPGMAAVLGREGGRCVFHDRAAGCRLHAALGPAGKPGSCRQFPWTAVHDPRGTFVSLSHYCPSAAALLFEPAALALVDLEPLDTSVEGIDVTEGLPPALDATRLMDWEAVTAWTRQALDRCARADSLGGLLEQLRALERHATAWADRDIPLASWLERWQPPPTGTTHTARLDWGLDARVRDAVPEGSDVAPPPDDVATCWRRTLERALIAHAPVLQRYIAARLVVCWPLHLGRGLSTATRYVEALLVLLAGELRREGGAGGDCGDPTISRSRLIAAVRRVDLLVLHLCDPCALASALDDEDVEPHAPRGA